MTGDPVEEVAEMRALGLHWRLVADASTDVVLVLSRETWPSGELEELHRYSLVGGCWDLGRLYSWLGGFLLRRGLDFFHRR